ncbi:MAG TPA: DUF2975 domain-containing protein [Terriglobales bacterium]|nr:DUF2975 domain-containing protein [Terriglobales bacterium]
MAGQKTPKAAPAVKAVRITLITLLILYGLVFVSGAVAFAVLVLPPFALRPCPALWDEIKVVVDKVLTGPVYFYIAYCIVKLIGLVSRGEPFSPASPRYIRRIGYAVFVLAFLHAAASAIGEFNTPGVSVNIAAAVLRILYTGLSPLLVGFGFLVIAKVIEVGVALKQDQDLTV